MSDYDSDFDDGFDSESPQPKKKGATGTTFSTTKPGEFSIGDNAGSHTKSRLKGNQFPKQPTTSKSKEEKKVLAKTPNKPNKSPKKEVKPEPPVPNIPNPQNKIDVIIDKFAKHGFCNLKLKELIESKSLMIIF